MPSPERNPRRRFRLASPRLAAAALALSVLAVAACAQAPGAATQASGTSPLHPPRAGFRIARFGMVTSTTVVTAADSTGYSDTSYWDGSSYSDSTTVVLVDDTPSYSYPIYVLQPPEHSYDSYPAPTPDPTPTPTPPPFAIGVVSALPSQVTPGTVVSVSVQTTGGGGSRLDATWSAAGGLLVENKGDVVQWVAPATAGTYPITVLVTNPLTGQTETGTTNVLVAAK